MTRREENLVEIIGALVRLHADGKHESLTAAMKTAAVVLLNPSPVQCEGVALDLLKLSPVPSPVKHVGLVAAPGGARMVVDARLFGDETERFAIEPIERPIAPPYVHHPKKDPDR